MTRILSGMYPPSEGVVLINSINAKEICKKSLYSNISVGFQAFQKYMMTLRDNITISDANAANSPNTDTLLRESASKARIDVANEETFPDEYDTMLSRKFGGVDLSGGEWQRVAIARGLYRKCDLIFLDEPTAAIDPIEAALYRDFISLISGKTAIIVTHRLGSVRLADRIIVLDREKFVGDGIHEELLITCPQYQRLFHEQAK